MKLKLQNTVFQVEVLRKKRKSFAIQLVHKNHLKISSPVGATREQVEEVCLKKQDWILQRNAEYKEWDFLPERRCYEEGEFLFYQGKPYRMKIKIVPNWKKHQVFLDQDKLEIWGFSAEPEKIKNALTKWLIKNAEEIIKARIQLLSKEFDIPFSEFALGNSRTLWGTCRSDFKIRINWRSIFLPPDLLDYLLIHELCHCLELNHSKRFWKHVEKHCSDWRTRRKEMKKWGRFLYEMQD